MVDLKVHSKMFTTNELGEYWQSHCIVCLGDVYAFRVDEVHYVFQDDLSVLIGHPICKSCYNDLKDKIPDHIDLIKKNEIKKSALKSLPEQIFGNIEKTHQAPRCKICNLSFPRLNQKTMTCDLCKHAKENSKSNLEKWLKD